MSRAVDRWPVRVRPFAFLKVVLVMPMARAYWFIIRANPSSDPPMASPMAVAASFADLIAAARIR